MIAVHNAGMIRLRRGTIRTVVEERPGAVELSVEVDDEGEPSRAIAYPGLVGPVRPGDRVLLNTTAVALGLGTGGLHFVVAVNGLAAADEGLTGRTMKLRYTPEQVSVLSVEEPESPHRGAVAEADSLDGMPVVWIPLHSMLAPAAAGARVAGAASIVYVMTDRAALPAGLSRLLARLRAANLVDVTITSGQAFGGDLEAVTVFSALLAARHAMGADVAIVGDGPGNTGTGTVWGTTALESAQSLNAAAILGGRPVAALRISFADLRPRHRNVSHHSITALSRVALVPVTVAVPTLSDEERRATVWATLRAEDLDRRHQVVEANGRPALDLLEERGIAVESMGRTPADDPEFFLAAGAAGVLAGRMAAGARTRRRTPPPRYST
jgi:hypothetical protein